MQAVSWKHATIQQAQEAGFDLFPRLLPGGVKDISQELLDAECLVSYGIGVTFPSGVTSAEAGQIVSRSQIPSHNQCRDQLAQALKPFAKKKPESQTPTAAPTAGEAMEGVEAVDWMAILKLALQFILTYLG